MIWGVDMGCFQPEAALSHDWIEIAAGQWSTVSNSDGADETAGNASKMIQAFSKSFQ